MFTPIHLLPQLNNTESYKYTSRWNSSENFDIWMKIIEMIKQGAGEHFLQWDFAQGNLGILEDDCDLKGITIQSEDIDFPTADNFSAIDFSYASFYNSKFKNATFGSTGFSFMRIYNCVFEKCYFHLTGFYGTKMEKTKFIGCDFIDSHLTNCDLNETIFQDCFFPRTVFFDCKFDERTFIDDPLGCPKTFDIEKGKYDSYKLDNNDLAEIFKGIKEGYIAGDVTKRAREYFFKEKQSITRYNTKGLLGKFNGYFIEWIAGYGIRPFRVLLSMVVIFLIFSLVFISQIGISQGLLLSAGGFFTFGAYTDYLKTLGLFYKIFYIAESFFGISLMALFITVLANLWFRER